MTRDIVLVRYRVEAFGMSQLAKKAIQRRPAANEARRAAA